MRTWQRMVAVLGFLIGIPGAWAVDNPSLSLDGFLGQVKEKGPGYQAASKAVEGLEKQKVQTELLYSPQVVAHAVRVDDRQESAVTYGSEIFPVDHLVGDDYGVGLVKKWKYLGATTAINYGWNRGEFNGTYTGYKTSPSASVTLPLWRDFLGRQSRAQMDKMQFQIESAQFDAAHQRAALLYQARAAYWSLQLAREEVGIRNDTLARATTIVSWAQRRVDLRLAENAELLQAKAAKKVRELELEQALENERAARVAFNRLRGVEDEEVPENLQPLEPQLDGLGFAWPEEAPQRWDVRGAEAKIKSDKAAWVDAKANAWPDFNVFASYTANGLGSTYSDSLQQSRDDHHPTGTVGGSIVIPLDVFTAKKSADGYNLNYQASKATYEDKALALKHDWIQLKRRLEDVNRRLDLATEIEKIQKAKASEEKHLLDLGRSTQFQMQSYETDYALARLQRLSVITQKLALWAEGEWMMDADKENKKK